MATHDGRMILAVVSPWPVNSPYTEDSTSLPLAKRPGPVGASVWPKLQIWSGDCPVGQGRPMTPGVWFGSLPAPAAGIAYGGLESSCYGPSLRKVLQASLRALHTANTPRHLLAADRVLGNAGALCRFPGRAAAIRLRELPDRGFPARSPRLAVGPLHACGVTLTTPALPASSSPSISTLSRPGRGLRADSIAGENSSRPSKRTGSHNSWRESARDRFQRSSHVFKEGFYAVAAG